MSCMIAWLLWRAINNLPPPNNLSSANTFVKGPAPASTLPGFHEGMPAPARQAAVDAHQRKHDCSLEMPVSRVPNTMYAQMES